LFLRKGIEFVLAILRVASAWKKWFANRNGQLKEPGSKNKVGLCLGRIGLR